MYKCCNLVFHGLSFYPKDIMVCCYSPNENVNGGQPPFLFKDYDGRIIPKEELFEKLRKYSSVFKSGSVPEECRNCFQIKEADWNEGEYINFITITHYSNCNADCVYCSNNYEPSERTNDVYKVLPFLKYLKDNGIIRQDCELHLGGGEFTIYSEAEDILKEFGENGFAKIHVATNGIKYSEGLYNSIKKGNTRVVISLDSGTRKTFKKIKRIDAFEKVLKNAKLYTSANPPFVTFKYIIIPGINDNMSEFKKFLKICKNTDVEVITIDIEGRYLRKVENNINPFYFELAEKMKNLAVKKGFNCFYHSFIRQPIAKGIPKKTFKNFVEYLKLKYLHTTVKDLYTNHKYCD